MFGEFSYEVTDKLTLSTGLRWFEYDRSRSEVQNWPIGVIWTNPETGGANLYQGKSDDVIKKFSAKYEIDDDKMVYYTYSEGFKLGGHNHLKPGSNMPKEYKADQLLNNELGLKSEWLDNKLRINLAYYWMTWEDMQREVTDPADWTNGGHLNIGEAEASGIEGSFTYQLTNALKIEGTFSKSKSEITEDFYFSEAFADGVIAPDDDWRIASKGQDLAISPDMKWWLGAEYTFENKFLGVNWWMRYDQMYTGEQAHDWWNAQEGINTLDSYTIANLQVGVWSEGDWTATLSVNNVWDKRAKTWVSTGNDWILDIYDIQRYKSLPSIVRPREISLTVKYNF